MTQPRSRDDVIKQDVADLHRLGYAQELFRSMGGFSNFAISFSIISILTGAVILYDYGLAWAGTAAVLIGWPLVTVFVLLIAASHVGDRVRLPDRRRPLLLGQPDEEQALGLVDRLVQPDRPVRDRGRHQLGGRQLPQRHDRHTDPRPARHRLRQHHDDPARRPILNGAAADDGRILMLIELAINIAGINLVALLNQVSVWWHIAIVGHRGRPGLPCRQTRPVGADAVRDPATGRGRHLAERHRGLQDRLRRRHHLPDRPGVLLLAPAGNWTYTGYDASAHVAEETVGARIASAWGVFLSVAVRLSSATSSCWP